MVLLVAWLGEARPVPSVPRQPVLQSQPRASHRSLLLQPVLCKGGFGTKVRASPASSPGLAS